MKKTDPAEAEKLWAMIQDVKAQAAKDAAAAATAPPIVNAWVKQLDDLRALRASLTPAQLQAQAREGYTSKTPVRPVEHAAAAGQDGSGVSVAARQPHPHPDDGDPLLRRRLALRRDDAAGRRDARLECHRGPDALADPAGVYPPSAMG